MKTINYRGIEYPIRYVGNGAMVSIESLNDVIHSDNDEEVNFDAVELDEAVSGYVPDEMILLSEDELTGECIELGIIEQVVMAHNVWCYEQ